MDTNFLDDLAAEVRDVRFSNGVIGKVVVYNMEERQRVKIVDYVGTRKVDQSKIDDKLKEKQLQIRLDSFIDRACCVGLPASSARSTRRKGYQFAEVKPEVKEVEGGPKLVNVTFHISQGPKVRIRAVEFQSATRTITDSKLNSQEYEGEQGAQPVARVDHGDTRPIAHARRTVGRRADSCTTPSAR